MRIESAGEEETLSDVVGKGYITCCCGLDKYRGAWRLDVSVLVRGFVDALGTAVRIVKYRLQLMEKYQLGHMDELG